MLNSVRLFPPTALLVKPHLLNSTRHLVHSPRTTDTDSDSHVLSPCTQCVNNRQQHRTLLTPSFSRYQGRWRLRTAQQMRMRCGLSPPASFLSPSPINKRRERRLHCGSEGERMQSFGKIIIPIEQTVGTSIGLFVFILKKRMFPFHVTRVSVTFL